MNYEEEVMSLIGAAGESKDYAFQALNALKNKEYLKAKELIKKSHDSDVQAHNVQTRLISNEMNPEKESVPMTLLMAHAQDHFMTTQLARELVEHLIDVFEVYADNLNDSNCNKVENSKIDNKDDDDNGMDSSKNNDNFEQSNIKISQAKKIAKETKDDNMRILLCCEGGLSTNLLMQEMKKSVKNSKNLDINNFKFDAIPVDELERKINDWDVVLIGPQVGHKLKYVKEICESNNKPYTVIDKDVYGAMDGATVAKMAIILYRKNMLK